MSCQPKNVPEKANEVPSNLFELPNWAASANIYEVNIRQYTKEGTINAFKKHLPRLKEMGVDILWFMPIYPISTTKKKGTLGSYYSVNNFLEINPEFGTMKDVDDLIKSIHDLDMKIILDWVPNHTGWDHVWLKKHPEWYTQDANGNIIDPHNDQGESHGWTDVADLNYNSKEMRKEMLSQLEWWVKEKDIDGYRMDIAFGVPDSFWHDVRDQLFSIKPIFMLAESENAEHRNDSIFHSTYGWNLFHVMNDIAKGKKSVEDFIKTHQENESKFKQGNTLIFTSNHDENAWNGTVFERLGNAAEGWAVVMALLDGIPLIYGGMEEPLQKRLEFFEKDTIGFSEYRYSPFYKELFKIKHNNPALYNLPLGAKVKWSQEKDSDLLSFSRSVENNTIEVLFNTGENAINIAEYDLDQYEILFSNRESENKSKLLSTEYLVLRKK